MSLSRRHFFFGSLLAGSVPSGGFGSTASLRMLGYKSPNEKLNIASIGAGGKAASDIRGCAPTENIVALCDVDDKSAAGMFKQFENAPKYKDFRKMLDKEGKSIDACIVTIPDFMHATAALACMQLGLTPAEALVACTVNAAWVLGRAGRLGRIAPGYDGDVVILEADDWRHVSYHLGGRVIADVFKRGELL